jgi:hypothetical protein
MSEDCVEDSSVPEGNDAADVVSVMAVAAQNFKCN